MISNNVGIKVQFKKRKYNLIPNIKSQPSGEVNLVTDRTFIFNI